MSLDLRGLWMEMHALNERQQTADEYEDVRPLTAREEDRLGQLIELFDALGGEDADGALVEVAPPPGVIEVTFDGVDYYFEPR